MTWHTIADAVALTGRSRRSIYRDMDAGRVSYRMGIGGRREFDTSELIRAYGELRQVAQHDTAEPAQAVTVAGTPTAEQFAALIGELQALRLEVSELRGALLRIEHKPEPEKDEWSELVTALRTKAT
jgi:hypothetical protein